MEREPAQSLRRCQRPALDLAGDQSWQSALATGAERLAGSCHWFAKVRPLMERIDFETAPAVSTVPDTETPSPAPVAATKVADLLAGRVLSLGDSGPTVRAIQLALARLGYDLQGTGYFGGATDTAVTDFQRRHALVIDSEVGRQ